MLVTVHRADRHDRIAVDLGSGLVHREHAVCVAVVRDAQVDFVGADDVDNRLQVRRAAAHIDVHAVGLAVDRDDLRAEPA